jgi:hypothetical protein
MSKVTVYRDTPKRGETDSKWCYYISSNGHIVKCDIGFETEADAMAAALIRETKMELDR